MMIMMMMVMVMMMMVMLSLGNTPWAVMAAGRGGVITTAGRGGLAGSTRVGLWGDHGHDDDDGDDGDDGDDDHDDDDDDDDHILGPFWISRPLASPCSVDEDDKMMMMMKM